MQLISIICMFLSSSSFGPIICMGGFFFGMKRARPIRTMSRSSKRETFLAPCSIWRKYANDCVGLWQEHGKLSREF